MKFWIPIILLLLAFTLISCTPPESNNNNNLKTNEGIIEKEVLTEDQAIKYEEERITAQETQEKLEASILETELSTIATGIFEWIATGHNGEGWVTVKDNGDTVIIELSEDFSSDKGPDLYLILTKNQPLEWIDPVQLDTSKILKIAPLVSLSGKQSYEVSKVDFEANNYGVAVWCNEFNVVFAGAVLK